MAYIGKDAVDRNKKPQARKRKVKKREQSDAFLQEFFERRKHKGKRIVY